MSGFTTLVTVLRPKMKTGRYGTVGTPDWTQEPDRLPLSYPVSVQPASSSEGNPDRPMVTTHWVLIGPPGQDPEIRATDRIETSFGEVLSVDGDVARFPHPTRVGAVHHVEIALKRVSG